MIQIRRSALVRHTPEQMFDLVNAVAAYPSRFDWCSAADVLDEHDGGLTARLDLRMAGITQSFTTENTIQRPMRIDMQFVDGPFKTLHGSWNFDALGDSGCKVALALDFEVSNPILGAALKLGLKGLADRMVDDFCRVADQIDG
ncbi:MAG: type II toxin-antitoxin system RatA family toxin [Dokdonella sp.]